jgi:HEAT repeat protein
MPAIDDMTAALARCARNRDTAVDLVVRALHGEDRAFLCSIPGLGAEERASFEAGSIPPPIEVALRTAGRAARGAVRVSDGGWMISASPENPAPWDVPDDVFVEERDGQLAIFALHARARLVRSLRSLPSEPAVRELRRAAEHGDGAVRASALDALSRVPAERLPGEIFRSISDPDPRVRAAAARVATAWPSDGTAEALGKQLVEERDPRVASTLIDALGATRSRLAVTFLMDVLLAIRPAGTAGREEAWSVKADWSGKIHRALVNLDQESYIQQLLLRGLEAPGAGRAAAVAELGKWIKTEAMGGSASASPEQTARDLRLTHVALSDEDPLVRACAGGALRWSRVPEVVTTLKRELSSAVPERRAAAARALGWLRDDAARDALRTSLEHDDVNVQLAAAEALGRLADDRSMNLAAEIAVRLALGPDMELRRAAGRAIDAIPGAYRLLLAPLIRSLGAQAFGDVIDLATVRVTARPDDAGLLYIRGNALFLSGRADESLADLQRSCNIDDSNPFSRDALARALLQQGRYAEALPHARFAASHMPTEILALRRLGEAALFTGEYAEAIEVLDRSEQIETGDAGTLLDLGLAHAGLEHRDEAHHAFDRFLDAFRRLTPEQAQESLTKVHAYLDKFLRAQPQLTGRLSALTHMLETL